MKSYGSNTIYEQNRSDVRIIEKIYFYKQHMGKIKNIVNDQTIKVIGDATSLISTSDKILVPFINFSNEDKVSSVSYDSANDESTIAINGSVITFDDSYIGTYVTIKNDVSDKISKSGIKGFENNIEGDNLFQFDSGKMDIMFDNYDGYFRNKNKDGYFDDNNVVWIKYWFRYKRLTSESGFNWFSGLVDISDSTPDLYNKTITIRLYGHSYELTRYPAYDIINTSIKTLPKIGGITINKYIPSDESEDGIKNISYNPYSSSKMKGISIESVSSDTEPGIKILEFRYPNMFRWDNGTWVQVATIDDTTDGKKKLYAKRGSSNSFYAVVVFGSSSSLNEFPDEDTEIWVNVKDDGSNAGNIDVSEQGMPILNFNNGSDEVLKVHLQRVLKYIDSTGEYTDETDYVNTTKYRDYDILDILENDNDEIILVSSNRFWGVNFILKSALATSDLEISYSLGGESFSAPINNANNGLVDDTNGLTEEGTITWTTLGSWVVNNLVIDDSTNYKGFMIRIRRIGGSGSCSIYEIRRIIRALGGDGGFLEFEFNQDKITKKEVSDEEIVIKQKTNGDWKFGSWYENVTLKFLLEKILDNCNYYDTNRFIDDMKIIKDDYNFNIWGRVPIRANNFLPTAMTIDFDNEIIYAATEKEIWYCGFEDNWQKLTEIPIPNTQFEYYISMLWLYNNNLYIIMEENYPGNEYHLIMFFRYDLLGNKLIQIGNGVSQSFTGKNTMRNGVKHTLSSGYNLRGIGRKLDDDINRGEDICIPFKQYITVSDQMLSPIAWHVAMYPTAGLEENASGFPAWYFSTLPKEGGLPGNSGEYFNSEMGFFAAQTNTLDTNEPPPMHFSFSYGQQGCMIEANDELFIFKLMTDNDGNYFYILVQASNYHNGRAPLYYNVGSIPICHYYDKTNGVIYFGFIIWNDNETKKSYSYISKYAIDSTGHFDWDKAFNYDNGTSSYTDITNNCNNGIAMGNIFTEIDDIVYLGSSKKFRNLQLDLSTHNNNYIIEYWDGSSWTEVPYPPIDVLDLRIVTFDLPDDWGKRTVNGSSSYYYIRIKCTAAVANTGIVICRLRESIIWDSQLNNSGNYERFSPIWLEYNESDNCLHGSMFNKKSDGAYPFQWYYFVLDLNNETVYFKNIGSDFTFDGTYLLKDFEYDNFNNCVYCVAENIRYKDRPSYIIKATYPSTGNIVLSKYGTPLESEWGSSVNLISNNNNGNLYGITKGSSYSLWEKSKQFYPRIELSAFRSGENCLVAIKYISQIMNFINIIRSERVLRFTKRDTYDGTFSLEWDKNMIPSKPELGSWDHYYDAVSVKYQNIFDTNYKGDKKKGFDGWMKKILSIDNPLIQNVHLAKIVVNEMYDFYYNHRLMPKTIKTIMIPQIECSDRFNIIIPSKIVELDSETYFILTSIKLNKDKVLELDGLEIL